MVNKSEVLQRATASRPGEKIAKALWPKRVTAEKLIANPGKYSTGRKVRVRGEAVYRDTMTARYRTSLVREDAGILRTTEHWLSDCEGNAIHMVEETINYDNGNIPAQAPEVREYTGLTEVKGTVRRGNDQTGYYIDVTAAKTV